MGFGRLSLPSPNKFMSNCIDFLENYNVFFRADEINLPEITALLAHIPEEQPPIQETWNHVSLAWWFVVPNNKITSTGIMIQFGQGRAIHSRRDFRALINGLINPLMLKKKEHIFVVKDEGSDSKEKLKVIFGETL